MKYKPEQQKQEPCKDDFRNLGRMNFGFKPKELKKISLMPLFPFSLDGKRNKKIKD